MPRYVKKRKSTKEKLPQPASLQGETFLPSNAEKLKQHKITFSFARFDRDHELFNLGGKDKDKTVGGSWFLRLFDRLKDMSNKTIVELMKTRIYDFHRIDYWEITNTKPQKELEQYEFWKFRVDKSHGRVIGILIDSVFYIMWLDPYHNFTDSEGYGGIQKFPKPN